MFGDIVRNRHVPGTELRVEPVWLKVAGKVQEKMQARNLFCSFAEEADKLVISVCMHLTPPLGYIEVQNPGKPVFTLKRGDLSLEDFQERIGFKG